MGGSDVHGNVRTVLLALAVNLAVILFLVPTHVVAYFATPWPVAAQHSPIGRASVSADRRGGMRYTFSDSVLWRQDSNALGKGLPRTETIVASSLIDRGISQESDLSEARIELLETMEDYLEVLAANPDKLVVVKVFAGFCRACKAFDVKYRRTAIAYAGAPVKFCEMDWMKTRDLCKSLQVKKLPHLEFYAGEKGRVESFVCGPSKSGLLSEKLEEHLKVYPQATEGQGTIPEFTDIRALYEAKEGALPNIPIEEDSSNDNQGSSRNRAG